MKILERFTCGKSGNETLNEDKIVETTYFTGVIDGATSLQGLTLAGMSNGRFAAETLALEISRLPEGIEPVAAIRRLSAALKEAALKAAAAEGKSFSETWSWPAAALLLYSHERKEIWRVADSTFVVDGETHDKTFPQESIWSLLRQAFLYSRIARSASEKELLADDPSYELLTPLITEFKVFANYDGPYGYGVLNGAEVPVRHIEVYDARNTREVILASDGYPQVFGTLAETEAHLAGTLAEDPLMYRLYPQVNGVRKGHLSFDDRTYIRFSL